MQDDEEVTYDDGPCCPKCTKMEDACQVRTKMDIIKYNNCTSEQEYEITYCAGTCGESTSIPLFKLTAEEESKTVNCSNRFIYFTQCMHDILLFVRALLSHTVKYNNSCKMFKLCACVCTQDVL